MSERYKMLGRKLNQLTLVQTYRASEILLHTCLGEVF